MSTAQKKIDIWDLLRRKFPEKEYALMAEVRDAAGFHASRSADYILVNLWPSRGLHLSGIELKSFRSDFLNELKNPRKAENIFQFCDFFWLLTTDEDIAKIDEIPVTWGWLCIKGNRIIVKKEAPKLTPLPIDRHFLAAMLKRANDKTNFVHVDSIDDRLQVAREEGERNRDYRSNENLEELNKLRKQLQDFEAASGIKIGKWDNATKIGEAVKLITSNGVESIKKQLLGLKPTAEIVLSRIATELENLNKDGE